MSLHEVLSQSNVVKNKYSNWIYTGLYGSQNYHCDWSGSDVDTKSIVGLSFSELIQRKDINKSVETIVGSTDNLADVKDIHSMFGNFLKSNINFLEILCTDYYLFDEALKPQIKELRSLVDDCAYYNLRQLIHATVGQFKMKCAALEKPFESKMPMIEKYGYDPKQLASARRLVHTADRLINLLPFKRAIDLSANKDEIIGIKSNPPSLDYARKAIIEWTMLMEEYLYKVQLNPPTGYEDPKEKLRALEEEIYKILLKRTLIGERQ